MVSIGFVGDVCPGPVAGLTIEPAMLRRLRRFDLLVANLEGPITGLTEVAVEKGAHLRSAPGTSAMLETMGVGVVSLANNHMFDFGAQGFRDTISDLDRSGIAWVGAGEDLRSARRSLVTETEDGLRVGFLAYSSPIIETVCATEQSAGCAPLDPGTMEKDVRVLAGSVDVAVVLLHWGLTGYELPTPEHHRIGPALAAAGATLVVGSHPHVVQGIALRGSGLVAFSLGDFAFYPETAEGRAIDQYRARQTGMILSVDVRRDGVVAHDVILTRQKGDHVAFETSRRRHAAVNRASTRLADADAGYLRVWKRYVLARTLARTVKRLPPWKWKGITRGTVKGLGVALRELFRR